jgi:sigma-B regulation protein RsbU (phosphoserine phosphatase)
MDGCVRSAFEYGGTVFVVNKNGQVIRSSETEGMFAASLEDDALDLRTAGSDELADFINRALAAETGLEEIRIDGKEYFIAGAPMPTVDWAVVSVVEKEITERTEKTMLADFDRINGEANDKYQADSAHIRRIGWLIISVLLIISVVVALFAAGRIVKPLNDMTKDVIECADTGNLFEMKDRYKTRDEIEVLAESFDDLSAKTKQYIDDITRITKEKERVNTELNMASRIQTSMLPHDFPPFPDRSEFGIYASMKPAKEVGGDFYDFFLIDEDHLCMVIADVSGKGVPAALFMMVSKAIIKSNAKTGKSPAGILAAANDTICGNNQMQMFVTVWLGILEISTGKLTAANAGHEYPALMKNGRFELFKDKHGFVIGGMDGVKYKDYEVFLDKGDKLFVYTDGVPEATDAGNDMFGVERMLAALNEAPGSSPEVLLENVRKAVDGFVNGATQFDDLTMLCVEYDGSGCDRGGEAAEA